MASGDGGDIYAPNSTVARIRDIYADIKLNGYSRRKPFAAGRIENRMKEHAEANNIVLASKSFYMGPKSLRHARRDKKLELGIASEIADIANFPRSKSKMDLYWDGEAYIYTNYKDKFIIHPNYEIKLKGARVKKVAFVTAGKVTDEFEFENPRYEKVQS